MCMAYVYVFDLNWLYQNMMAVITHISHMVFESQGKKLKQQEN